MGNKDLESILSTLRTDQCLIVDRDQGLVSVMPAEIFDPELFKFAKTISKLPGSSWLHLLKLEDQLVFILSYPIDQNQGAFLTFPSTMRISQLEEKLVLLQNFLNRQDGDQSTDILQDLTSTDLKAGSNLQPKQDDFLSIFSELEKVANQTHPTPPNLSDTQPISL